MPTCVRQQVAKLSRSALDHLLKRSFPQHFRHCCRPCGLGSTAPSRPSLHSGQVLGSNCQPFQDPLPKPLLPPRALRDHLTKFNSVAQLCLTLGIPMDCSTPGLPVLHQLPELAQTHIHRVGVAIQPSHPLLSPSPAFNLSQHQGLFQ